MRVAETEPLDSPQLAGKYATQGIRSNIDSIVNHTYRRGMLETAHESLWDDPSFIKRHVEHGCERVKVDFLRVCPQNVQHKHVDLIVQAISEVQTSQFRWDDLKELASNINREVWLDRKIIKAWFSSSHAFIPGVHDHLANDEEVFLLIAEHCQWTNCFRNLGQNLKQNDAFLVKLLKQSPRRYVDCNKRA